VVLPQVQLDELVLQVTKCHDLDNLQPRAITGGSFAEGMIISAAGLLFNKWEFGSKMKEKVAKQPHFRE